MTISNGGTGVTFSADTLSYGTLAIADSASITAAKVKFSPEWVDAIKEAIEPWLMETINEVMANQPVPLAPLSVNEADVVNIVQKAVTDHKAFDHIPMMYPAQMTEYSLPNDLKEYKLVLKGPYGSTQQYELPLSLLPKLLAMVTL